MNLMDVFCQTAQKRPNHPAIIGPRQDDVYSYHDLRKTIESVADRMKAAGIRPGSCVGLHYSSGREYIILTYALWRCGACAVPIPVELVAEEKQIICRDICLSFLISKADTAHIGESFKNGNTLPIIEDIVVVPVKSFRKPPSEFSNINAAFLRFTSGTTATSKGVILSHETIYDRVHAANDGLKISPEDRIIWLLSMSYHFAVSIVSYLSFGATIVLCKNHLGATVLRTAVEKKGTLIYGSPFHYELMSQDRSSLMLANLRLAISTTTSLRSDLSKTFYNRFKLPLSQAYGIIEVGLPCINLDHSIDKGGSVGRVLPAYEIRMKDVGLGKNLKSIELRGKGFLDAYYDPWKPRKNIMPDGWFQTGDLGKLDKEGFLYILGRSKEIINVSGMKFFPQEVESVLVSHPNVKEACVYPHVEKRFGEIPYAQVVLERSMPHPLMELELKDYCRKYLTPFKVPEKIQFVGELTKTASGKPIRKESRITTRKELAIGS